MTNIYFIADTHFGKKYSYLKDHTLYISERNVDQIEICEDIVNKAIEDSAAYVIFLGDVYDRQLVSPTIRKLVRERIFDPLSEHDISVLLIGGNHDSIRNPKRGVDILDLESYPNVSVITEFKTKIIEVNGISIGFVLLPFLHFDVLVSMAKNKGIPVSEDDHNYIVAQKIIKTYVSQMVENKLKECDRKFLLGHYYLEGAKIREIKNPSHIYGEFKFNKDMVQKEKFDWVIFGHVHLKQTMWGDDNVIIPGSIDRLDMGERDSDKYYCTYDIESDTLSYEEIDCRTLWMKELEISKDIENYTQYVVDNLPSKDKIKDGICKLIIQYPQGSEARLDKNIIEEYFEHTFYYEIKYRVLSEKDEPKLRELSLDPLSLFGDYIEKQYEGHQYYDELKANGTDLLTQKMHEGEILDKGALSIKSVDMQYFNKYGKGPNKVEFDEGSYVIQGPTGAGKSSILDAITFALFKRSSRTSFLTLDEILYENGYVEVEFELGDKILNIRRNHSSPKLVVRIDGEEKYKGLTITEKEDKIENIIGYDYDGFRSSFFIQQQELQIFSDRTSSERQDLLKKLFKLKIFDDVYDILKEKLDDLEDDKKTVIDRIEFLKEEVNKLPKLKKKLDQLKEDKDGKEGKIEENEEEKKKLGKLKSELKPESEEYKRILNEIESVKKDKLENTSKLEKYEDKQETLNSIKKKIEEFEDVSDEIEQLENKKETLTLQAQERKELIAQKTTQETLLNQENTSFKGRKNSLTSKIEHEQERLQNIDYELSKDEAFQVLINGGKLTERFDRLEKIEIPMAREYKDEDRLKEFKISKDKTEKHLNKVTPKKENISKDTFIGDEIEENLRSFRKELEELQSRHLAQVEEIEEEIEKIKNKIKAKGLDKDFQNLLEEVKKDLKDLNDQKEKREKIQEQIDQAQDHSSLIEHLKEEIKTQEKKLESLESEKEKLHPKHLQYQETEEDIENMTDILKDLEKEVVGIESDIKNVKKNIEDLNKKKEEIKKLMGKKDNVNKNIEIFDLLRNKIFHSNGVPQYAINEILPSISIRASAILSELTDSKYNLIKFKKLEGRRVGFEITVYDGEMDADREASTFSGGEKTQINAAIRFAIMEKITEIPDTTGAIFRKSDTLFIDEGDLGTLDDISARQRFVEQIESMKTTFSKIILITHLEDVAENFPNRIMVDVGKDGRSKIIL